MMTITGDINMSFDRMAVEIPEVEKNSEKKNEPKDEEEGTKN